VGVGGLACFLSCRVADDDDDVDDDGDGDDDIWRHHHPLPDLSKSNTSTQVLQLVQRLVPDHEALAASHKLILLQSIVAGVLCETVFGVYFAGLTEAQSQQLREAEELVSSLSESTLPPMTWYVCMV